MPIAYSDLRGHARQVRTAGAAPTGLLQTNGIALACPNHVRVETASKSLSHL